jgi:hypothetical protein
VSVQDYYAEWQKGMIHAGVHEETEEKIGRFYSTLHTEIQDIIDHKEYDNINYLFQLAMLAKKELEGCQPKKTRTSFTPRLASTAPYRTATPFGECSSTTTSASRPPSTSSTPSTTTPHATDLSKASVLQGARPVKPSSSNVSTSRTSDIKCHRCHGISHMH